MSYFDWRDHLGALAQRFPERVGDLPVRGHDAWRTLVARLLPIVESGQLTADSIDGLDPLFYDFLELARKGARAAAAACCVFVSHRQCDVTYAERIAYLAAQSGFQYWLDVHDPSLTSIGGASLPSPVRQILIAAIIEIGLLNSTHVIAVHTRNSDASMWIPYEVGRVKEDRVFATRSCGWFDKSASPNIGEYAYLAERTASEAEVVTWLKTQRRRSTPPNDCFCVTPYWRRSSVPVPRLG